MRFSRLRSVRFPTLGQNLAQALTAAEPGGRFGLGYRPWRNRARLGLESLTLGPGSCFGREGSTALSCRALRRALRVLTMATSNHQKRGVRFVSLLKPTGDPDPVRSASALRQGISCTTGDRSG